MFRFLRYEVYVGCSVRDFSKVREILAGHKIPYTFKVYDPSQQWSAPGTMRGNFGSLGSDSDCEKLYYVYVKNRDSEQAAELIRAGMQE